MPLHDGDGIGGDKEEDGKGEAEGRPEASAREGQGADAAVEVDGRALSGAPSCADGRVHTSLVWRRERDPTMGIRYQLPMGGWVHHLSTLRLKIFFAIVIIFSQ